MEEKLFWDFNNNKLTNFGKFAVVILSLSLPITIVKSLFRSRKKIKWIHQY